MIINGENLILGRLAAIAAKKALLGEKIDIVNAEKVVIVGKKSFILRNYKKKFDRKTPIKGPFIPRTPDRFLRRVIRGMLPYKKERGNNAFKKVMCHVEIPDNFKNEKLTTFDKINVLNTNNINYLSIGDLCKLLKNV
ncbi:MAG: 50S ribosomal protein L13 [Nanoarchaeota archaeon]|nr:50S ribosomal protein L13 [Nanoarchaeota archaeon]